MTRVLVQFLTGYSRYNKGETAGFDEDKAKQLCTGKSPVARLVGPVKEGSELGKSVATVIGSMSVKDIDLLDRERQELALAGVNMANQLASVERREEDLAVGLSGLDQREKDLATREAAVTERERAFEAGFKTFSEKDVSEEKPDQAKVDPDEQAEPAAEAKGKAPGAPPKQGAKA